MAWSIMSSQQDIHFCKELSSSNVMMHTPSFRWWYIYIYNSLYFKGQVSSKGMSMPLWQVQIQNGCGRVGQVSLFNCPKASWYRPELETSATPFTCKSCCKNVWRKIKKGNRRNSDNQLPTEAKSQHRMAFSILATPQTPNCLGSASEFHYEKTVISVISPADKCGHYTVITFHIHFTIIRPTLHLQEECLP